MVHNKNSISDGKPRVSDFRFMWRGKPGKPLVEEDVHLLAPIDIRGEKTNRALLLLHGFASSPAVYRELIPKLTMYDAIICPVLPGHATTLEDFSQARALDWLSAAEQACAALCETYKKVDVMGLSLGGLLAYHLSNKLPVHHLYLLAPSLALKTNISFMLKLAQTLHALGFSYLRNQAGNLYTHEHAELTYRLLPLVTIIEILTFIQNTQFTLPSCPVDVFLGRHDEVVDSTCVAQLFKALPQNQIHWLNHSAHVLPLDGDRDSIIHWL